MNNKFGDCCNCPALVDGRFLTRYDDRIEIDLELMKKNNITDSLVLRKYLIDNGAKLIESNIKDIEKTHKCNYNKKEDTPVAPINSSYYIGTPFSDPTITYAPFDNLSNTLVNNTAPVSINSDIPTPPARSLGTPSK
jgi:hypothetical protein